MNRQERVDFKSNNFSFWPTNDSVPSLIQPSSSDSSDPSNSLDSSTKKPPVAFKPHKLLYPMRSQSDLGKMKGCSIEQSGDLPPRTGWVGVAPLDMIQSIVSLAENSPEFSAGLQGPTRNFLNSRENGSSGVNAGEKRKIDHVEDETLVTGVNDDEFAEALVACYSDLQLSDSEPNAWKPSDSFGAAEQVTYLDSLAEKVEHLVAADPKKQWIYPSYNRVQQACVCSGSNADSGKNALLEIATTKMQVLFDMASAEEPEAKAFTSRPSTANTVLEMERPATSWAKRQSSKHRQLPRRPKLQNSKQKKDVFQATMVAWLKFNWANPFPDDVMLQRLATYMILQLRCITVNPNDVKVLEGNNPSEYHQNMLSIAIEKISNWLVNQRTRTWRPSIERAFDRRRPAAMLLEDSIRLFEKKNLRPLVGWDSDSLFSFAAKYSRPFKTWKRKRRAIKAEKPKEVSKSNKEPKPHVLNKTTKKSKEGSKREKQPHSHALSDATSLPPLDISPVCTSMAIDKDLVPYSVAAI